MLGSLSKPLTTQIIISFKCFLNIFCVQVPTQASSKLIFAHNSCLLIYCRNVLAWKRHLSRSQEPYGVIPWEASQLIARPVEIKGSLLLTSCGFKSDHQKHRLRYFCAYHLSSDFQFHVLLFARGIARKCLASHNTKGRNTICTIIRESTFIIIKSIQSHGCREIVNFITTVQQV